MEDEEREVGEVHQEMSYALVNLLVHYGLLSSVMPQYPEHVKVAFVERMEKLTEQFKTEVLEVQQFGEAFDE